MYSEPTNDFAKIRRLFALWRLIHNLIERPFFVFYVYSFS